MIKTIPNINDYCVSNHGKVFRIVGKEPNQVLKPLKNYICNGHNCIKIRGEKFYIANLVAELFLGPKPEGTMIFHKNKNKLDDDVSNLVYLTPDKIQLYSTYTEEYLKEIFR